MVRVARAEHPAAETPLVFLVSMVVVPAEGPAQPQALGQRVARACMGEAAAPPEAGLRLEMPQPMAELAEIQPGTCPQLLAAAARPELAARRRVMEPLEQREVPAAPARAAVGVVVTLPELVVTAVMVALRLVAVVVALEEQRLAEMAGPALVVSVAFAIGDGR